MARKVKILRSKSPFRRLHRTLSGWSGILKMFKKPYELDRRIAVHNARLSKLNQDHAIGEIDYAIKHNKLVLLDIEIDKKKLELKALERKLGNPDDFAKPLDKP